MKSITISKNLAFIIAFSAGLSSFAADRFSVKTWEENFAAALQSKNAAVIANSAQLETLEKSVIKDCTDCENKQQMKRARGLFAKGRYEEARLSYNSVSKASDYWLEAVEEIGWTYFRQNRFDDVLSQTKTLMSPPFNQYVHSEVYLLQALSHLKSCDYKDLFVTNTLFKENMKSRLLAIQKLSESGMSESVQQVIAKASSFPMKLGDVGPQAMDLPYLFYKDAGLQRELLKYKVSEAALSALNKNKVSTAPEIKRKFEATKHLAAQNFKKRMRTLATQENEENFKIVQKLNLVEIEAIQRLHFDVDLDQKIFKKDRFKETNADQLVFIDDGRPWFDELDKYEVRSKFCPQNIRRKM